MARPEGRNLHIVGPVGYLLCVEPKDQKPFTPCPASSDKGDARSREDGPTRFAQGPPVDLSVRLWGRPAGVGQWERGGVYDEELSAIPSVFCYDF